MDDSSLHQYRRPVLRFITHENQNCFLQWTLFTCPVPGPENGSNGFWCGHPLCLALETMYRAVPLYKNPAITLELPKWCKFSMGKICMACCTWWMLDRTGLLKECKAVYTALCIIMLAAINGILSDTLESECLSYWNHNKPAPPGTKLL